jgi:chorismate synthase
MLRYLTAGESHGPALTAIVEGIPAGVPLTEEIVARDLARRQVGFGRGGRMAIETDRARILSGVRFGRTLGSPIALLIENRDWENWGERMAQFAPPATPVPPITTPRPGHADLAGMVKYGTHDLRDILERSSARETAARVAVGAVCRALLAELGVKVFSHVVSIGDITVGEREFVRAGSCCGSAGASPSHEELAAAEASDVRCADAKAAEQMRAAIRTAGAAGDTLGGVVQIVAIGLPVGLGSCMHGDRRLDGRLAGALMSIPAIKGVEIGLGFAAARLPGSQLHDAMDPTAAGVTRRTNHAGGIEGGMTNGEPLLLQVAMKPIPTMTKPLPSIDIATGAATEAHAERSDVCAVPAAGVVAEAMVAYVLADAVLEEFGADTLERIRTRWAARGEAARS